MERLMRRLNGSLSRSVRRSIQDVFQQSPLDLRFALQKTLDPRISFTRASSGTYIGSDGLIQTATTNAPRFDHNPTTGESLGLLVEEARTNLLLQSEDLATTWTPGTGTVITTNTWTAPDGTLTGNQFTVGTSSTAPSQNVTVAASSSYTLSFYLNTLLTTSAFLRLRFSTLAGSTSAFFNISTLAFGTLNGITNPTVQLVGTNIYRLSVTHTYDAVSAGSRSVAISSVTTDNGGTADTGKIVAIWGMQYELGAFPTSYIPTTTATVTRAADVASITGSNFSSWYNQTEGTVFGQFLRTASTNSQQGRVFSFNNGTNTNAFEIYQTGASNPSAQITATTAQALWTPSGFTVGTSIKEVLGYQLNNSNASFNGSAETLDTACNIPTVTQARIGDRQDGVRNLNGTIRRLTYWPTRLADTTLQQITQP